LVKSVRKYCSEDCFREATGRAFSREKVLDAIKGFVCEYGRIPIQATKSSTLEGIFNN